MGLREWQEWKPAYLFEIPIIGGRDGYNWGQPSKEQKQIWEQAKKKDTKEDRG